MDVYNMNMWQEIENKLYRKFEFTDFDGAMDFMSKVAKIARSRNHHPKITNLYNIVELELNTHDAGDIVTDKDRQFAEALDTMLESPADSYASEPPVINSVRSIKLFGDGGSRGNPGPSACGIVLMDMDNNILLKKGIYLGVTTNNQAEYQSLKQGLEAARSYGAREVAVHMDSMLVVNQMKGIFKVKNRDLWPIHEAIKDLAATFKKVTYTHVPRELNKLADAEVNAALDAEAHADNQLSSVE